MVLIDYLEFYRLIWNLPKHLVTEIYSTTSTTTTSTSTTSTSTTTTTTKRADYYELQRLRTTELLRENALHVQLACTLAYTLIGGPPTESLSCSTRHRITLTLRSPRASLHPLHPPRFGSIFYLTSPVSSHCKHCQKIPFYHSHTVFFDS